MAHPSLKYDLRGVSASKDEVHQAIKHLDKGLYPNAFCKVIQIVVAQDPDYCNIMHVDTALAPRLALRYIYWRETGDLSVWKGIVEDAIVMNLDDMACVGAFDHIVLSSTIGRNKSLINADVISTIINYTQEFLDKLSIYGIGITLAGGETADVGDIVRTIDVGYTAFARMKRADVIDINIKAGDYIVGFSSYGQCVYEDAYNGGMGSNGLTSSRHDVLSKYYAEKYPESFNPNIPNDVVYTGSKRLTDKIQIDNQTIDVGKLILSPTRTYMPLIKPMIEQFRPFIHGLIHCSGGGQTKVSKFMPSDVAIIKDQPFDIAPLFQLIQEESGLSLREMYQVFNMGHRLEAYTTDEAVAQSMIELARSFGIEAKIIGRVEKSDRPKIIITTPTETIDYLY
ncbi:MAG: AIR synthase-related protein [Saprospiraceae bacterium]